MNRQQLEKLKLPELKEELTKYKLPHQDTRAKCIDALMTHFERNAPHNPLDAEELEESNVSCTPQSEISEAPSIPVPSSSGVHSASSIYA